MNVNQLHKPALDADATTPFCHSVRPSAGHMVQLCDAWAVYLLALSLQNLPPKILIFSTFMFEASVDITPLECLGSSPGSCPL